MSNRPTINHSDFAGGTFTSELSRDKVQEKFKQDTLETYKKEKKLEKELNKRFKEKKESPFKPAQAAVSA